MNRVVLKYGGSSVSTIEKMQQVAKTVVERSLNEQVVVVISAMGKTTNELLSLARQASSKPSKREMDLLLATGEQTSIALLTMILKDLGVKATAFTGFQAGIKTEGLYTKNKIVEIDDQKIQQHLQDGHIVVVAGFQGINQAGDITTLGRGGSDTTAVALGARLGCPVEIYTDVDGIYTIDPRIVPHAKKLDEIAYEEMKEMSFLGAKVMEYHSLDIGERYHVPIYVAKTSSPTSGTWIKEFNVQAIKPITGVSISEQVMLVTIKYLPNNNRVVADVFVRLADEGVNVDMISESYSSKGLIHLSFTCQKDDEESIHTLFEELKRQYEEVQPSFETSMVKVSVVGTGMRTQSGVAAMLFKLLAELDVAFRLVTTSEISISFTIPENEKERVAMAIANHFDL
jgi:aspartate kinase